MPRGKTPHDPNLEYKQHIVLILCFMIVSALSLILYVGAFHIHWRARR
jgi:hypothetical protein